MENQLTEHKYSGVVTYQSKKGTHQEQYQFKQVAIYDYNQLVTMVKNFLQVPNNIKDFKLLSHKMTPIIEEETDLQTIELPKVEVVEPTKEEKKKQTKPTPKKQVEVKKDTPAPPVKKPEIKRSKPRKPKRDVRKKSSVAQKAPAKKTKTTEPTKKGMFSKFMSGKK